jgi:hypothetical protein
MAVPRSGRQAIVQRSISFVDFSRSAVTIYSHSALLSLFTITLLISLALIIAH